MLIMLKNSNEAPRIYASYGELEGQIFTVVRHYAKLTVRQLYYILISKFKYTPSRKFYKILNYHLTKLRRKYVVLNEKFSDPTRHFIIAPFAYPKIELWVEKDSIRNFLEPLATKYRISIQVLRGFASLSVYERALERAKKRKVKKILFVGDHDPSGLLIEKVAGREMEIEIKRLALTLEQAERYRLPSIPVNRRDSRATAYIKKYRDRAWEVEALRPRTFLKVIEEKLRENIPSEYLVEAESKEQAAKVAKPIVEKLRKSIEEEVLRQLKEGKKVENILSRLARKLGVRLKK